MEKQEEPILGPRILALVCLEMPQDGQIPNDNNNNDKLNPEASDLFSQPNHKLQPLIRRALRVALNYGVIQLGDGNYNLHFICRSKLKIFPQEKTNEKTIPKQPTIKKKLSSRQSSENILSGKTSSKISNVRKSSLKHKKIRNSRRKSQKSKKFKSKRRIICPSVCLCSSCQSGMSQKGSSKKKPKSRKKTHFSDNLSTDYTSTRTSHSYRNQTKKSCCTCCGQKLVRTKKRKRC